MANKLREAAIVMLGMGEKCATEILKNMTPKEVQRIIEEINKLDNISEKDVIKAINEFFKESSDSSGMDLVAREVLKHSLSTAVEQGKIGSVTDGVDDEQAKWIDLFKIQPVETILTMLQDEHPQIIAVVIVLLLDNFKGSALVKGLKEDLRNQVIKRIATLGPISTFAMDGLSQLFKSQLNVSEKYNSISVDGLEAVANIMSYLDNDTSRHLIDELGQDNKLLTDKIQEKIMPFEGLAELDQKSLQTLLKEVKNDDLVLALKGVDQHIKDSFLKNMSAKAAEILKDDIENKGPVKVVSVLEAQKRIMVLAKKLADEEKIILTSKSSTDIIY